MFNAIWAKMMGLQLGITFARSLSLFVEFELDSAIVMDMVNKGFTSTTLHYSSSLSQLEGSHYDYSPRRKWLCRFTCVSWAFDIILFNCY